jgi:predicted metal-binding protein
MSAVESVITKRQVLMQISICKGCCCGRTEKGRPDVPVDWLKQTWKERKLKKHVQLSISGCLGPCDIANVICIQTGQGTEWLGNVTQQDEYAELMGWATACAEEAALQPLPERLQQKRFTRWQS